MIPANVEVLQAYFQERGARHLRLLCAEDCDGCQRTLTCGGVTWRFYATSFDFFRSIEIPLLSYGVVLGSMFIINLVRAHVLLDDEQAKEIGRLNLKVQETDDAEKIRSSKKKIEGTLGGLVHEGRQLFNKLERCGAPSELSSYVNETEEWKVKVTQELQSARPTEGPAFQFADVNAAPLWGVVDLVYKAEVQRRKLMCHINVLEEIMKRRI